METRTHLDICKKAVKSVLKTVAPGPDTYDRLGLCLLPAVDCRGTGWGRNMDAVSSAGSY